MVRLNRLGPDQNQLITDGTSQANRSGVWQSQDGLKQNH